MSRVLSYRDLDAWQKAMTLVERCYKLTASFPRDELFGLTAQVRRAAVSIPANIAEGHRRSRLAYLHHLAIALGSQAELETQLELATRLNFLKPAQVNDVQEMNRDVGRLLHGLVRSLDRRTPNP